MNDLGYQDPVSSIFKRMEAMMNFDFNRPSCGLKKWIKRPHNLLTNKDKDGKVTSFGLEVVYTPFKKDECKVQVIDNQLSVTCGSDNKVKDEDMDWCGVSHQSYRFTIPLSDCINTKAITARAEDGMLYIDLPVKEVEEKKIEAQTIEIK